MIASVAAAAQDPAFDRQAWLTDYAAIKAQMAQHYANLDSRLESKRVAPAMRDMAIC
jgi:hypothetical protein